MLSNVVFPVPVPPEIIILSFDLTAASKKVAILAVRVPFVSSASILSKLVENFLIVITGFLIASGGIIAFNLEPSSSLASTIGLLASIVLPNGSTIL